MARFVKRFGHLAKETGASMVEYTLLVALIAAVAIGAVTFIGHSSRDTLCQAGKDMGADPTGQQTASGQTLDANCQ